MNELLTIHSNLNELLANLYENDGTQTLADYQNAYLRFRGLVDDATVINPIYGEWSQRYLIDVSDESGEVVKLHESIEDLTDDIEVFISLVERTDL